VPVLPAASATSCIGSSPYVALALQVEDLDIGTLLPIALPLGAIAAETAPSWINAAHFLEPDTFGAVTADQD